MHRRGGGRRDGHPRAAHHAHHPQRLAQAQRQEVVARQRHVQGRQRLAERSAPGAPGTRAPPGARTPARTPRGRRRGPADRGRRPRPCPRASPGSNRVDDVGDAAHEAQHGERRQRRPRPTRDHLIGGPYIQRRLTLHSAPPGGGLARATGGAGEGARERERGDGSPGRGLTLRTALVLVAPIAFAASAAGIDVPGSHGAQTTGDEPHYLLSALSLGEDGNLDVSDEIARGAYLPFHRPAAAPGRGRAYGRLDRAPRPPAAAPPRRPVALGGWVGAKLALAGVAAALAALIAWIAVRRLGVPLPRPRRRSRCSRRRRPSPCTARRSTPSRRRRWRWRWRRRADGAGSAGRADGARPAVTALPWLSVKYAPVAAALAAIGLWRLARGRAPVGRTRAGGGPRGRRDRPRRGPPGDLRRPHALRQRLATSPAGAHVVGTTPTTPGGRRLVGLMVDRDFGLAAWQPAWLLVVPAAAARAARRPRGAGRSA